MDTQNKLLLYGVFHRFFPEINEKDVISPEVSNETNDYDILKYGQDLNNIIYRYFPSNLLEKPFQTIIHNCNMTELHLSVDNNHSQNKINLQSIFNIFTLSEHIPFCKWRDNLNKHTYYKTHSSSLANGNINKKLLECWVKGRDKCEQRNRLQYIILKVFNLECLLIQKLIHPIQIMILLL